MHYWEIMIKEPKIIVLHGGTSEERAVSLVSGEALAEALSPSFEVELIDLRSDALPSGLCADSGVVFPALHGSFGEDGQIQALMESSGIEFCGSDASASKLCMDKIATKGVASTCSVPTPEAISFDGDDVPLADDVIAQLGMSLVIKPVHEGSSVGLHFAEHRSALGIALSQIHSGRWMIEQRIQGRELTVGLLKGAAMGVVEIKSASGVYDYAAKYTSGTTVYEYPAHLEPKLEAAAKDYAERLFDACGCRDFARADFLLDGSQLYFLELNTLPGLTATSLLPKSASCVGYDFEALAAELIAPAVERYAGRERKAPA